MPTNVAQEGGNVQIQIWTWCENSIKNIKPKLSLNWFKYVDIKILDNNREGKLNSITKYPPNLMPSLMQVMGNINKVQTYKHDS